MISAKSSSDWLAKTYFRRHYKDPCNSKRHYGNEKFKNTLSFIFQMNLKNVSCLTLQILPEQSKFTVRTVSTYLHKNIWLYSQRNQTLCHYYFVIKSQLESHPIAMEFYGYYMNNVAEKDECQANILSNNGALIKSSADKEQVISFYVSGTLAMISLLMDMDYFSSLFALMVKETHKITSNNFRFQMSRIKEQSHELTMLFHSILSVNILKNTSDISQCKRIDIKLLPSTDVQDETQVCVDAIVSLKFYRGDLRMYSKSTETALWQEDESDCRFVEFACLSEWEYAFEAWYRIECNGSRSMSFVVDSKVSYTAGDNHLIFPRNMEFAIIHERNYKDIYKDSSDFVEMTISDTTECFNPIINFAQKERTKFITFKGRQYFLFNGDDVFSSNFWYMLISVFERYSQISWNRAAQHCESLGLHLLTIGDAEEERVVLSLLSQKSPKRPDVAISIFLGLITEVEVKSFRIE